ncbi:rCG42638 [Rattus norvegicus]|uniref:RCG42638 n=1 Tax=Rattus norvegicus TaxID=10116 RepID=A6K1L1_RAT|nr:rCG42638 [Rattus norvegicus]
MSVYVCVCALVRWGMHVKVIYTESESVLVYIRLYLKERKRNEKRRNKGSKGLSINDYGYLIFMGEKNLRVQRDGSVVRST